MKEVTKKDLPEISGGEFQTDGCIPDPMRNPPYEVDWVYPQNPAIEGPQVDA
jgi:hypothetical protein